MQGRGKRREGQRGMSSEGRRIWSIKIGCATSLINPSSFTLLMILWTFLTPLILIWQLTHYDSHTALRQYPTLHRVKSSDQVIFPFYPNFPMRVTLFHFITHFLFDLSSDSSCCSVKELSGIFPWLIDEKSLTDLWNVASRSGFPSCI